MKYEWRYQALGDVTYNVLPDAQIEPFLLEWVGREWELDHAEFPDQPWTSEWLDLLPRMDFALRTLRLSDIALRADLMAHGTPTYDFASELAERAREREESFLRGVSCEPLVVNRAGLELMDGYTRYMVFRKHGQEEVLAYVGTARQETPGRDLEATP
jgi:hypothetical protein